MSARITFFLVVITISKTPWASPFSAAALYWRGFASISPKRHLLRIGALGVAFDLLLLTLVVLLQREFFVAALLLGSW